MVFQISSVKKKSIISKWNHQFGIKIFASFTMCIEEYLNAS